MGWGTICAAIVWRLTFRGDASSNQKFREIRSSTRRAWTRVGLPPTIGGGEILQTQERDYFFAELFQLLRAFRWMRDGVDSDVAGAGFDVLGYLCGDVGGAA